MDPHNALRKTLSRSGKGIIEGLLGIVVIVVGIYLAFWVLGVVLKIIVLVIVAATAVYLFFMFVDWVKKIDGS